MTDVVDRVTRSRMMSGIKGKDTKPELLIRKALHSLGFRYRLHDRKLPGKPDIVLPKYKAVIFVHGCFWHKHDCHLFKWPSTRRDFWEQKISDNHARDLRSLALLKAQGWRVLTIWECSIKGKLRLEEGCLTQQITTWIIYGNQSHEILGQPLKENHQGKTPN